MKILSVVGARPNFIKIASFIRAISKHNRNHSNTIQHILVHTGQHYDIRMSEAFFEQLEIPKPDYNLEIGSGSHAEQVGKTMIAFEKTLLIEKPDWVVVVGDVNATLACSITAKKLNIKVCHIEAGIRSNDHSMPEEINRIVTDSISDLLLTPDQLSYDNLLREGKNKTQVYFAGNIMIDTLDFNLNKALSLSLEEIIGKQQINLNQISYHSRKKDFGLITLHRPSNVDDKKVLEKFIDWLDTKQHEDYNFIWTIHPRTLKQLQGFDLSEKLYDLTNVILLHPLSYLELLKLNSNAKFVITDSGGLQEECCVLGTPFLVLRNNTERSMTLKQNGGTGYLVGKEINEIDEKFNLILKQKRAPYRPKLWDGITAERCLHQLLTCNIN